MKRLLKVLALLAIFVILFFLYFPALSKYLKLRREEEGLNQQVAELTKKIEALKKEEYLIKNEPEHLERLVRRELGLVKPGEVVYKVVPVEKQPSSDQTRTAAGGTANSAQTKTSAGGVVNPAPSNPAQPGAKNPSEAVR